jgi:hypothetical protein
LEVGTLSPFHDAGLAGITQSINALVTNFARTMRAEQHLAVLDTPDGPFLAMVEDAAAVGPLDLVENINAALGIKRGDGEVSEHNHSK